MPEPKDSNGRTHEPNLREITADVDGLRLWVQSELKRIDQILDERDERYKQKFEAAKELNAIVAGDADKAVSKAETAQSDYNVRSNEFRGQLDDQAKLLASRSEVDLRFNGVDKTLDEMKKAISENTGRRDQMQWLIPVLLSVLIAVVAGTAYVVSKR